MRRASSRSISPAGKVPWTDEPEWQMPLAERAMRGGARAFAEVFVRGRCLEIVTQFILRLSGRWRSKNGGSAHPPARPHIVVGVTRPETCLVLRGRLRALREGGFRVTVVASAGRLLERTAQREGVEFRTVPMERGIAPLKDMVSLLRLCLLLWRLRPDVTEFSTPKAGLLGTLAARLTGVPVRVYMLRGLRLEASRGLQRRVLLLAERLAAACAQSVLCNSPSLLRQALALGVAPAGKLHLLGAGSSNGVDTERFSPGPSPVRHLLGLREDVPVVGFAGRLTYAKGVPDLIEAFERILEAAPGAHLLLAGWFDAAEDALSRAWKRRIEDHPRIHITGLIYDTAPYYRAMDLLVLPTWREGFPNVVLEAAATGVPAITTQATGAVDSVLPEVTGLLIPPGYPSAICTAVLELLADPARRRRMGMAARRRVCERFSTQYVLGLTVEWYRSMAWESRRGLRTIPAAGGKSALNPV